MKLWNDPLAPLAPALLQAGAGMLLLAWASFPYPTRLWTRIQGIVACGIALITGGLGGAFISWSQTPGNMKILFWGLGLLALASIPSLAGSPLMPPRSPSLGSKLLTGSSLGLVLLSGLLWILMPSQPGRGPSSASPQIRIWLDPQSDPNAIHLSGLDSSVSFILPFAKDQMVPTSHACAWAEVCTRQWDAPCVALLDLGTTVTSDKGSELVSFWEAFKTFLEDVPITQRPEALAVSFVSQGSAAQVLSPMELARTSRQQYNQGIQDAGSANIGHVVRNTADLDLPILCFCPAILLDDLSDEDPGLQTALNLSVVPPWEWSEIYCTVPYPASQKDVDRRNASLSSYARSAIRVFGKKAGILLGPIRPETTPSLDVLLKEIQILRSAGIERIAIDDLTGLSELTGPDGFQQVIEALRKPDLISPHLIASVVLQRHMIALADILAFP